MRLSIERAGVQVLSGSSGDPGEPFPAGAVQTAARAGLQAAAVKAKLLADAEERNVLLLVRKVIVGAATLLASSHSPSPPPAAVDASGGRCIKLWGFAGACALPSAGVVSS